MASENKNARPKTPPRDLSSIFNSSSSTNDFRLFLADLDKENEDDEQTLETQLMFVLACRKLSSSQRGEDDDEKLTKAERKRLLRQSVHDMHGRYFTGGKKVSLTNDALWKECQRLCADHKHVTEATDLKLLWKAHDDVIGKLDDLHMPFLEEQIRKGRGSPVVQAAMCLL